MESSALPYFRGQAIFGYLNGTIPTPPQEIDAPHPNTGAIIKIPNPQYLQWLRQDSLILSTINASLTEDVLTQVMSYTTSQELANARKGALSANAYFLSIKRMADELALAGQPLKPDDIITYVLARLGQEYDSLDFTHYSIRESRIHHNNKSLPIRYCFRKHCHQATSATKPIHFSHGCKFSTISPKCYHRFNISYQDQQTPKNQPQAMVAAHYQYTDNEWHPDTGATLHLTNDVNNIHLQHEDYGSPDHIQVGNGAGLLGEPPTSRTTQYSVGHRGYKCLDVSTGKIFVSRHVVFDESLYPYTIPESIEPTPKPTPIVLPPNLNLSLSSSSVSVGINVQSAAPSPLHMASTSRPHTNIVSGSLLGMLLYLSMKTAPPILSSPPSD
ncbi:hypothetical protein AAG906_011286 [Vitis piasezkii]